jgi:hypothetical protein
VFDGVPGHSVVGRVQLSNRTGGQKRIGLRAVDVRTAATGGLEYGAGAPRSAGRWLTLARRSIVLSPGTTVQVPFRVRVPAGAGPGDHFAGIVAVDSAEVARQGRRSRAGGDLQLRFVSRLAIAVHMRLPGPAHRRMEFRGAEIVVSPAGARLVLRLRNAGNRLLLRSHGDVTVSQDGEDLFTARVDPDSFVPGTEIGFPVPWLGRPARGTYRVHGVIRPRGAPAVRIDTNVEFGAKQARQYKRQTGKEAKAGGTPMLMWVVLCFAGLLAVGFGLAYARARQELGR